MTVGDPAPQPVGNRQFPCILAADAEEYAGEGDTGGTWTPRPRYDVYRKIMLPFRPTSATRFSGVFPPDAPLCLFADASDDEDDEFLGWKPLAVAWDCRKEAFVIRLPVAILLPWEAGPETLAELYPGWEFVLNEERSKGQRRARPKPDE